MLKHPAPFFGGKEAEAYSNPPRNTPVRENGGLTSTEFFLNWVQMGLTPEIPLTLSPETQGREGLRYFV